MSINIVRNKKILTVGATLVVAANLIHVERADGESGTRYGSSARPRTQMRSGSTTRPQVQAGKLALDGYCAVCVINMRKWVQGKPQYQTTYDGKTYYFPSEKERRMFLTDPAKYVPALGGDCTVCLAKMGKRMDAPVGPKVYSAASPAA